MIALSIPRRTAATAALALLAIGCSAKESPPPTAGRAERPDAPASDGLGGEDAAPSGASERAVALEPTPPSERNSHEDWRRELDVVTVYRVREHGGWIRGEQLAQPSSDWGQRLLAEIDQAPAPEARQKRCLFEPGVEVVFRAGDDEAHVRLCFSCGDLAVRLPGQRDFGPMRDFVPRQAAIERLVRGVIPGNDLGPESGRR